MHPRLLFGEIVNGRPGCIGLSPQTDQVSGSVGEIVFVHRPQDIGLPRAHAHIMGDHQARQPVAVDQNDALLGATLG
jgi:hypothetical protein